MIRSLSTAVSGLRNHQNKLDVVGNNIANVNTVGYKYNTALFQDVFSQTVRGATAPQPGQGGINPVQVGLGMGLSASTAIHTQGALTSTGRESDMAIEGRGFFVVSDGAQNFYTRDGSFVRDSSGVLVNANGMTLMGWVPVMGDDGEDVIDTAQPLSNINIPLGENTIAKATSMMDFVGNLDASKGRPSYLSIDNDSNIQRVLGSGLRYGDYQVITETAAASVETDQDAIQQAYIQSGAEDILEFGITNASNRSSSIVLSVSQVDEDSGAVYFTAVSHQYSLTGEYSAEKMGEERIPAAGGTLEIGDISLAVGAIDYEEFTAGDRFLIAVNPAGAEHVEINSPGDITHVWARDANGFDDQNNIFKFYSLNGATGSVYDGLVSLNNEDSTMGQSTGLHTNFTFTLDDDSAYHYTSYAYDSLGNQHFLDMVFRKTDINTWEYVVSHPDMDIDLTGARGTLVFDVNGRLIQEDSDIPELVFDPLNGAEEVVFTPDLSPATQLVAESNVIARRQDGFAAGELVAYDIGATGIVSGTYTNGMIKELGQVAMASFINPEGLFKIGANLYDVSANSGDARIGVPGDQGRGMIQARSLEMSNVDLANEFTEMITTNRAFQANSRVISTSDEVLQELVNIKR